MSEIQPTSYDEIPYGNSAFYYTHPDRLATGAALFGMQPPAVDHCRVLELGCARGGNLIPMAQALPESRFVGIDFSCRQIDSGQEVVEALGLSNIELRAASILDVDEDFGPFDYIICHGVYSWVPAEVQNKILDICARNLAANGVAYVSYNTYPGWHVRGMIREMMKFHVQQFVDPHVYVQQARAFVNFLAQSCDANSVYGLLLKEEADQLGSSTDSYLFHEHLEEVNQPLYFYQFCERAAAKKLQYLGEVRPSALACNLPPAVKNTLERWSANLSHREQYLDFLCNRTFRRTLLCHDQVALQRTPSLEALMTCQVTTLVKPVAAQPDIHSTAAAEFRTAKDVSLSTNRPLVKAALVCLFEVWPRALRFDALWKMVQARLAQKEDAAAGPPENEPRALAEALLQCYLSQLVELHRYVPQFVLEISERPAASPLARLQAATDTRVTNLRHCTVELNDFDQLVLRHLDGTRDRAVLQEMLAETVANGELEICQNEQPLQDGAKILEILNQSLESSLRRLAGSSLLVG